MIWVRSKSYCWEWKVTHPLEFLKNVCFDLRMAWQRANRGWAVSDTWSFDYYLGRVLVGGLRRLAQRRGGYPGFGDADTSEKWTDILTEMADGFQAVLDYEDTGWEKDKNYQLGKLAYRKQAKALKLLAKWFPHLWD